MPIRKRITDLHGQEYKEFQKRRRDGPPPDAPRKPKAEERQPILDAFKRVPLDQSMPVKAWNQKYQAMFIDQVFPLWGVDLALYPSCTTVDGHEHVRCVGLFVLQLTKSRRGTCPKLMLKGEPRFWYGTVIDWIGENQYGL